MTVACLQRSRRARTIPRFDGRPTLMTAMKSSSLGVFLCFSAMLAYHTPAAADPDISLRDMVLANGWLITQDVRQLGERIGWYEPDFITPELRKLIDQSGTNPDLVIDWQPIDRLAHLQLVLAPQPYFGRSLRYFNDSPWWYRVEFDAPGAARGATLRFEGVDYFAKVWLNGTLLGEHEGYADPFEFEVGSLLRKDHPNVVVVKVSSPWDHEYANLAAPEIAVVRDLIKGSYEHADTFVQRDVNPIGIWRPVKLLFHGALHEAEPLAVTASLTADQQKATVKVVWPVINDGPPVNVDAVVHIRLKGSNEDRVTKKDVVTKSRLIHLEHGANTLEQTVLINSPKLWTTWDRGRQPLYQASLQVVSSQGTGQTASRLSLSASAAFGVRTVDLHRTADETRFFINGKPIYLRGTTYWPDLYLSNMTRARYERDIDNAVRAGINAFRVHVHTENPEFYEICDRRGIVVIQDNDLNWVFPTDPEFRARAAQHFGTLVKLLRNHPSVIAWIAMNEVFWGQPGAEELFKGYNKRDANSLGAHLAALALKLDPTRSVIENSGISNDLASGDSHDYRGSLNGGHSTYFDIFSAPRDALGGLPKLVTEFGVDAPPALPSLRAVPEAAARLADVLPRVAELQDYQYHLLKYYMENYRIHKYAPNAGYFQFMWIDFSPQSFYGVYDYWGKPKTEGLGGGLRAMEESNQPIAIFMEHGTTPRALYAVNDTSDDLGRCIARWRVTDSRGLITEGSQPIHLGPDGHEKIRDFTFPMKSGETYNIALELRSSAGTLLASNRYINPFQPQPRPEGYPDRIDDELGMRLWWGK
jgi:beta-mannosidase